MKPHYLASCQGKQRFTSYREAALAAKELGSNVSAYKCKYCDYYHRGRSK